MCSDNLCACPQYLATEGKQGTTSRGRSAENYKNWFPSKADLVSTKYEIKKTTFHCVGVHGLFHMTNTFPVDMNFLVCGISLMYYRYPTKKLLIIHQVYLCQHEIFVHAKGALDVTLVKTFFLMS